MRTPRTSLNRSGLDSEAGGAALLTRREGRGAFLAIAAAATTIALLPGATAGQPTLLGWDKIDHAGAFAAMTLAGRCGWPEARRWTLALGAFTLGAAIEALQAHPVVGRTASVADMAANAFGIGVGLLLAAGLARLGRAAPFLSRR